MPHAVELEQPTRTTRAPKSKGTSSPRELRQLHTLYSELRSQYLESDLSHTISRLLETKNRPAVTKLVSLGLGSFKSVDQTRRIKQLVIFLALADQLQQHQRGLQIYAQDPSFSKTDEAFLQSLGVHILCTHSATAAGEAAQHIDESTLVYCPFLTLEAYQLFFAAGALNYFIGDDFDALRVKWPKHSAGSNDAELVFRQHVQALRKRAISAGDGFWDAEDKPFPMAVYSRAPAGGRYPGKQAKAKL